jgi:hypothetical protein
MGDVIPLRPGAPEPYMTKRQAATYLARSTRWVDLRMRDSGLPFRKVAGQCLYRASEIDAWVSRMAEAP